MTLILLSQLKLSADCKVELQLLGVQSLADLIGMEDNRLQAHLSDINLSQVQIIRTIMQQYILQSAVQAAPVSQAVIAEEETPLNSIKLFNKLSKPAHDGLAEMNVHTVEQLITLTGTDMMRTNLMDIKTIDEILKFKLKYQNGQFSEREKPAVSSSAVQPVLSRLEVVEYLVDKHGKTGMDFDELMNLYGQYLQLHQLEYRKVGNKQTFIKAVADSRKIIKTEHKMFRPYHFEDYDWQAFYAQLDLLEYNNEIISTAILFEQHKALMEDYHIHNKEELHNIIRKTVDETNATVFLMKLPMIGVGEADRETQLINFVKDNAPLTQKDLFKQYKAAYGISESSIRVNDELKAIDPYYDGAHYQSAPHEETAPDEQVLAKLLKKQSIIFLDELKEQYYKKTNTPLLLTKYQTQQLGYRLYHEFVLPLKYKNANDYFNKRVFNKPVVDLNQADRRMVRLQVFQTYLNEFLTNRLYIEVADKQFIALKEMRQKGVNKAYIRAFEKKLNALIPSDRIIAIHEVIDQLDDNLFKANQWDEKVYYTILRGAHDVQTRRVGGATLARKGNIPFSFGDLIVQMIEAEGRMTVDELMTQLKRYTIELPKQRIIDIIEANETLKYEEQQENVTI